MELKINKQQQAQNLYYQTDLSQAEIAGRVGVSTRTVSRWITNEHWKSMKQAARHAPAAIVEKLYIQLNELNDHILSREPGQRFPSKDEADIMRKLTITIDKLKQQTGLGEAIQLMMGFTTHVAKHNLPLAQQITMEANSFIKGSKGELHKPFEMIYDNEDTYPNDEDASNETMMDNARQPAEQQQTTPQPLPVKDQPKEQVPQKPSSLSDKKNPNKETMTAPDSETKISGQAENRVKEKPGLSKEEIADIVAQEKAKERRMYEYRRYHL